MKGSPFIKACEVCAPAQQLLSRRLTGLPSWHQTSKHCLQATGASALITSSGMQ